MATKKNTTTVKKTSPAKKSTTASVKKTTAKKSSIVKKEISPIDIESTNISTTETKQKKSSSVEGLREAITEAKKREVSSSKPVVKKISDIIVNKEDGTKKDVYTNNEFFEDTATYKKEEITKKPDLNDNNPKIFSIEDDSAKESAADKAKRLIDEFNEIKKSPLEQIEKKPATPYKMPEPMVSATKKKNPLGILIIGLVLILAGVSFFVFKNISSNKDANNSVSDNTTENALTVEHVATNVSPFTTNENTTNEVITPAVELVPAIETRKYTIQRGNTLAVIAKNELGDDRRWPTIFAINEKVLLSPDNFEPLTVIDIPKDKKLVSAMSDSEKKSLYDDYMKVVEYYQRNNRQKEVSFYKGKAAEFYKP